MEDVTEVVQLKKKERLIFWREGALKVSDSAIGHLLSTFQSRQLIKMARQPAEIFLSS